MFFSDYDLERGFRRPDNTKFYASEYIPGPVAHKALGEAESRTIGAHTTR